MSDNSTAAELATALTVAWLENASTRAAPDDVPAFLVAMHAAVTSLAVPSPTAAAEQQTKSDPAPAVSVRKSLADPDRIISMIDGKARSSLTRHLNVNGLTPDQYRQRYGLKADYPMVAPGYSKQRSEAGKRRRVGVDESQTQDEQSASVAAEPVKKPRAKLGIAQVKAAAKAHSGGRGAGEKA